MKLGHEWVNTYNFLIKADLGSKIYGTIMGPTWVYPYRFYISSTNLTIGVDTNLSINTPNSKFVMATLIMALYVEVRAWTSHYIPHKTVGVITYPCSDFTMSILMKGSHESIIRTPPMWLAQRMMTHGKSKFHRYWASDWKLYCTISTSMGFGAYIVYCGLRICDVNWGHISAGIFIMPLLDWALLV